MSEALSLPVLVSSYCISWVHNANSVSSVKNGLSEACVQGSIVKGTRSLKPSTIQLHEDLAVMSLRESELEKALADCQSSISSEPHPLLVKDPQIRTASPIPGLQRSGTENEAHQPADPADDLVATLGMMSINEKQYHGETATSEYLIKDTGETEEHEEFPFPPPDQLPIDINVFLQFLPPYERALQLLNIYHSYFAWSTLLAPVSDTIETLISHFYPDGSAIDTLTPPDTHRISTLFMIFLLGTLYDLDKDIESVAIETEEFHTLARAALSSYAIADDPTAHGIRAIILMIWYFRLFPGRRPSSYQWILTGVLTRLIQARGLHRDCSLAVPDKNIRIPYEQTFWEYYCVDIWQSFMFGRPTSMVSSMIDCPMPREVLVPPGHNPDFFPWKYSFTQLIGDLVAQATKTQTYRGVLEHEKTLKAHKIPSSLQWPSREEPLPNEPIQRTFQRYIAAVWRNSWNVKILAVIQVRMSIGDQQSPLMRAHGPLFTTCGDYGLTILALSSAWPRFGAIQLLRGWY
ncbi:hypothetical protein K439DRAFT_988035 [Ramaria rubella]|nr:hypothetical protein K439DRAFT_988035 [Ramaria rubella]